MNRFLVLYYSGVGNTKYVASKMYDMLMMQCNVDIYSIENLPDSFKFDNYSALVIGFPTKHSAPASLLLISWIDWRILM